MRHVDGTTGGGQILRTALSLALCTGEPFRITDIRAGRRRPGLMRQHLTAVEAAAEVCGATTTGAELGSTELEFRPGPVRAGDYAFRIGTAGSTGLVLQTVLPGLLAEDGASSVQLSGGTHNPWAPPFDFLSRSFAAALGALGHTLELDLDRHGFFPAGGGHVRARVQGAARPARFESTVRGGLVSAHGRVLVAGLSDKVGERERRRLVKRSGVEFESLEVVELPRDQGPGNAIVVELEYEHTRRVISGFGRRGVSAERVAGAVARDVRDAVASPAAVGPHLADQLLLPLALGAGGRFTTTSPPDAHVTSNADLLRRWLGVAIDTTERPDGTLEVEVASGSN